MTRHVHVVVPAGYDDPAEPSGGNTYDLRVCERLAVRGWTVAIHRDVAEVASLPDGSTVLVDGLIAARAADVLVPAARRLRLVVLVHMLFGTAAERAVLDAAESVVVTSHWMRDRVHSARIALVAPPGVDPAALAPPRPGGQRLLCVAAVTADKGHDVLLAALATIGERPWTCLCVGSLHREPEVLAALPADRRVTFSGTLTGAALEAAYAGSDLLVLPSRAETYGMVVTEALARGLPVIASAVGGVPEALGSAADGVLPGLLVPPGDPAALAGALRRWLEDAALRRRLRTAAVSRRSSLLGWDTTADRIADALSAVPVVRR
ncbi:MAG TPA: glycosyltransferase family 4 protein [Micromonosporaceae bacterium]|jgi:glycosyltransferase involved in cell wall biosynthesis